MKYYLIAGEKSGDLHGSNLMKALAMEDKEAEFRFWGGDRMQSVGGDLVVHYREMAVMGLWEVLTNILRFKNLLTKCRNDIRIYDPDVIILIDFAGFNLRIARFARENNLKVFYYISPKVWAWNTSRAWKVKKCVDRMFVILPFEKEFYRKFDWEVDYVGNPVVDAVNNYTTSEDITEDLAKSNKHTVAILPGSRKQEIKLIMPVLVELMNRFSDYNFLVAKVSSVPGDLYDACTRLPNARIVEEKAYDILSVAEAAVVTSGTATLETALFKVPQVVVYKADSFSYRIGKMLVKVPFFSLVNLIASDKVVTEFLQEECSLENIELELRRIIEDDIYRSDMLSGYDKMRGLLGFENASQQTAALMVHYLEEV